MSKFSIKKDIEVNSISSNSFLTTPIFEDFPQGKNGDIIYNSVDKKYYGFIETEWKPLGSLDIEGTDLLNPVTLDTDLVGQNKDQDEPGKFTIRQLLLTYKQLVPQLTNCSSSSTGMTLRYRNFSDNGNSEIYLGVGDVGISCNRTANNYIWDVDPLDLKVWTFRFVYDSGSNMLMQTLQAIGGNANTSVSIRNNVIDSNGNITVGTNPSCTTTADIPADSLNGFRINISNRRNLVDNQVILSNLILTTSTHLSYKILNNGGLSWIPPPTQQIIQTFSWPDDGSAPIENFELTGQLYIRGVHTSSEASRFEFNIISCSE